MTQDPRVEANWTDGDYQPLPPTFDDIHVPERQTRTCASCGGTHDAILVGTRPLGNFEVELVYKMPECRMPPRKPNFDVVEGGPVTREAGDE